MNKGSNYRSAHALFRYAVRVTSADQSFLLPQGYGTPRRSLASTDPKRGALPKGIR